MSDAKKNASIALKKAKTSIESILKMIENDQYCVDIVQQILAVNGLLKSASDKILINHMKSCFIDGMQSDNQKEKEKLVQEIMDVISLKNK